MLPDTVMRFAGSNVAFGGTHMGMSICTWCDAYMCGIGECNNDDFDDGGVDDFWHSADRPEYCDQCGNELVCHACAVEHGGVLMPWADNGVVVQCRGCAGSGSG
jgi:hypothetical protein